MRRPNTPAVFAPEQVWNFYYSLFDLVEKREENYRTFRNLGFLLSDIRQKHLDSICQDSDELDCSRRVSVESAKIRVSSDALRSLTVDELKMTGIRTYRSPYLEELRVAAGGPLDGRGFEDNPCWRRFIDHGGDTQKFIAEIIGEQATHRRIEAQECNRLALEFETTKFGRSKLITATAVEAGSRWGVVHRKIKAKDFVCIAIPVNTFCELWWLVDTQLYFYSPFIARDDAWQHNRLYPEFALCPIKSDARQSRTPMPDQVLDIAYRSLFSVELYGYDMFFDSVELEHIVRAHWAALGLVLEPLIAKANQHFPPS